jgi:hypothetical protein
MSTDEPTPRSALDSDIKIRQLQQYLHCPGRIPTAPHPNVEANGSEPTSSHLV